MCLWRYEGCPIHFLPDTISFQVNLANDFMNLYAYIHFEWWNETVLCVLRSIKLMWTHWSLVWKEHLGIPCFTCILLFYNNSKKKIKKINKPYYFSGTVKLVFYLIYSSFLGCLCLLVADGKGRHRQFRMFLLWSQKAAVAKANVNNYSAHGVWPFNRGEVKVYMSRESTHEAVAFEDSVVVVVRIFHDVDSFG